MAVHYKPISDSPKIADYRIYTQWLESNRYREIIKSGAQKINVGRFTSANSESGEICPNRKNGECTVDW